MNKRILLLPNDLGGGRGHVSRMMYLAQKIETFGYEPALALGDKYLRTALELGLRVFHINYSRERLIKWQWKNPHKAYHKLVSPLKVPPVFVLFSGLDYQVPRDGYLNEKIVGFRLKQLKTICTKFNPDLIIGDTHLLALILGRHCSIPVIQVTRKAGFPPKPDFLWWDTNTYDIQPPKGTRPFLNLGMDSLRVAEDLLKGDAYLIPSSAKIEPLPKVGVSINYSGPFTFTGTTQNVPFFTNQNEYPNIYITIGGGAERGQAAVFFKQLINIFRHTEFRVLVSTAGKAPAKQFNNLAPNIWFEDWVNGVSAIAQSDFVIFHGGYSTTMEILLAGKPSLVIPAHSEQEGNGRRLEKLGVSKVILPYRDILQPLEFKWTYGTYSMLAAYQFWLDRDQLISSINELLYGDAVTKVRRLRQNLINKQNDFQAGSLWSLIR